jgi:protein-S-isoprenylcysteine O-methyltransferase Ste14
MICEGRVMSRSLGLVVQSIGLPAAHVVAPWALSLLSARHGWVEGMPGIWNLLGLVPVAIGFYVLFLCIAEHFRSAPGGWKIESTPHYPTPSYLLARGPYSYSRNPIYLAEGVIWSGWIAFYGSLAVLGVFALASLLIGPIVVRREERGLEARFGEAYRAYKQVTPRWIGKGGW